MSDPANQETARIVLARDTAIAAFRAGQPSGLRALDGMHRPGRGLPAHGLAPDDVLAMARQGVPRRPERVELAILTALADTYGPELLTHASLGYVLRLFARHGGVALVQRVLFGGAAGDAQLAVMLTATRAAFTQIAFAWPEVFLAEAHALIAACCPPRSRPPGTSKPEHDEPNE